MDDFKEFDNRDDLIVIDHDDDFSRAFIDQFPSLSSLIEQIKKYSKSGYANKDIFCTINEQSRSVDTLIVGLGVINDNNLIQFLESQLGDQSELNTCVDFRDATNNGQHIIGKAPYIIHLTPEKNNYSIRYNRDLTLDKACYALANPCLTTYADGSKALNWHIQQADHIDLSGQPVIDTHNALRNSTGPKDRSHGL